MSFSDYAYRGRHRRPTGRGAGRLGTAAAAGALAVLAPIAVPGTAAADTGILDKIAACESGGRSVPGYSGRHFGIYQFDLQTWRSVGGTGHPLTASAGAQRAAAERLLASRGTQPWNASKSCWGKANARKAVVSTPTPRTTPVRSIRPVRAVSVDTVGSRVPNGYRVRSGDTLGKLARTHGTTVRAIATANGIGNPDLIHVGQRLV